MSAIRPQPTNTSSHRARCSRSCRWHHLAGYSSATMSLYTFQDPTPSPTPEPIAEEEEYYSSWSLFLVCILLVISLWTSYYLQIKRIRAIHETVVSIFAGMLVGFVVRLAPGHLIREMLVRNKDLYISSLYEAESDGRRSDILCSSIFFYRPSF